MLPDPFSTGQGDDWAEAAEARLLAAACRLAEAGGRWDLALFRRAAEASGQ